MEPRPDPRTPVRRTRRGPAQSGIGLGEVTGGAGDPPEHRLGVHLPPGVADAVRRSSDGVAARRARPSWLRAIHAKATRLRAPAIWRSRPARSAMARLARAWSSASSGRPCWMARNAWCCATSAAMVGSSSDAARSSRDPRRTPPARHPQPTPRSRRRGATPARRRRGRRRRRRRARRRIRCAPLLSPSTIQAQPNPLTMASASAGRARRSTPGRRRCWRARRGRTRGLGLACPRAPRVDAAAASANHAAWAASRARSARPRPSLERERADAVEQPVADEPRRSSSTMTSERLASRPTTSIAAEAGTSSASRTDSTAASGAPAGERGQRPQAALVVGEQQLVAPRDRRLQRAAALRPAAGRVAQHAEAVVEAAGDLLDRQRLGARRGELDRQRQPVERAAQVRAPRRRPRRGRRAARGVNSSTASASASGAQLERRPRRRRRAATWLVHRTRSPGAASSRRTASAAAASTTCSQLSRISSAPVPASRSTTDAWPPAAPIVSVTTGATPPPRGTRSRRSSQARRPRAPGARPRSPAASCRPRPGRRWSRAVALATDRDIGDGVGPPDRCRSERRHVAPRRCGRRLVRRPLVEDRPLQRLEPGPGSSPRSSASSRLTRRPAARASPCRPLRHSAVISATHSPSRCGRVRRSATPAHRRRRRPGRARRERPAGLRAARVAAPRAGCGGV